MRIRGSFVNFGTSNESVWQGHVLRSAWRQRRPEGLAWDAWHERNHHGHPVVTPVQRKSPCAS
jgi:hypothetical protein